MDIKNITDRLTSDMADYGMLSMSITNNTIYIIKKIMAECGWDKPESQTPSLENYSIVTIDQNNLHLNPFTVVGIKKFQDWGGYHLMGKDGMECPLENVDAYTLIVLAQVMVREYEKFSKK